MTSKGPELHSGEHFVAEIRWVQGWPVKSAVFAMLLSIVVIYLAHFELEFLERVVGTLLSDVATEWNLE